MSQGDYILFKKLVTLKLQEDNKCLLYDCPVNNQTTCLNDQNQASNEVYVTGNTSSAGNVTQMISQFSGGKVSNDIIPATNQTINLGSTGFSFNNIYT